MFPFLKRIVPLLIAIGLLAYAVKDISFRAISEQFQQANYGLIALVSVVTLISYFLRGKRWQLALQVLGYKPTVFRTTVAMQTGVISSMIILGSGELTRCATLHRTDNVPIAQGLGSVVAERIVDLFMLLLVLLLALSLEFGRMSHYLTDLTLAVPAAYLLTGAAGLVVMAVVVWLTTRQTTSRTHPLLGKVQAVVQGFGRGFMAIRQLPDPVLFVVLTVLLQLLAWLGTYLLLLAVASTHHLPPTAALTILAVSSLGGLAVPTQGGIGTFHFLVSRALILYGFTTPEGALVATFLHAVGFGINSLLSGLSFLLLPALIAKRVVNEQQRVAN